MRFRAILVDTGCIQYFTRVVGTIAKLAKTCVLRITSKKMYFILSEGVVEGSPSVWCELIQENFFNEYSMDGVCPEANEIFLELIPENLVKSLRTGQSAKSVKIKLTKKHCPCLSFEEELPSMTGKSRLVVHDIPVNVLPRRLWTEYDEPTVPEFDVSITLPPLKVLRNMVDRMKNLSNMLVLSANRNGEMKLRVETEFVTVATHFKDLQHPCLDTQTNNQVDEGTFVDATIDIRKLGQFLAAQQINPYAVLCSIEDQRQVHFLLQHDGVSLQYFIPGIDV